MTETSPNRPSLKALDADRNGQDVGTDSPRDVGVPSRIQAGLKGNPDGTAETARIASGTDRPSAAQDAVEQTEAETPQENLRRISDPSSRTQPDAAAQEAIERATAAIGQEEAPRHGEVQGGSDGK